MAKRQPVEPRFLAKVDKTESCWLWKAWVDKNGYGRFWLDGRNVGAHRVSYELFVGPISEGLQIDHLCRVHGCVNPSHLEPVTPAENHRRGVAPAIARWRGLAITHCPQGHAYDEENTYFRSGSRECLICKRENARKFYERNRELTIQRAREWRLANPDKARAVARESSRRHRAKRKTEAA